MTSSFPSLSRKRTADSTAGPALIQPRPCRAGSYPTVSSHTGEWSLNPSSHSLDWAIALVNAGDRSGSLEFSVGGDDAGTFFPVKVSFAAQGSLAGVSVASVELVDGGAVTFSQEAIVSVENYVVSG